MLTEWARDLCTFSGFFMAKFEINDQVQHNMNTIGAKPSAL
jgi:hypothetical protein